MAVAPALMIITYKTCTETERQEQELAMPHCPAEWLNQRDNCTDRLGAGKNLTATWWIGDGAEQELKKTEQGVN